MRDLVDMFAIRPLRGVSACDEQLIAAAHEAIVGKAEQRDFVILQVKIVRLLYHTRVEAGVNSRRFSQNPGCHNTESDVAIGQGD